ncbi:ABC transporter [Xylocopilactobacillus apis]|uniref:ABC transporter n=1 Tax=Xylocopilactobacillus apis TaxID=2932183 RepID=A0AAU9DTM3_9LACO|nr:ABC transporter [Xylocopilactobacillus apis]
MLAFMVGNLTDIATKGTYQSIPRVITITLVAFLITFASQLMFNYLKTDAIKTTNTYLRSKVLKGMLNATTEDNAEALGFLTNDFKLLETNRFGAEISIFINLYTMILALGYGIYLNWLITIIFIIGSCIPMIVSSIFQKPIQKSSENWSKANTKYVNQTKNFLAGTDTFRLYQKQDQAVARNSKTINVLENTLGKMNLINLNVNSAVMFVAYISTFLLPFLIGILLILKGFTTIGALFGIVQLSNSFVNPILTVLNERNNLSTTKNIVRKVNEYLTQADQLEDSSVTDFKKLLVNDLTLKRKDQVLAAGINLEIESGEKVAVIGPSGSGKSTLMQFLMAGKYGETQVIELNGTVQNPGTFSSIFAYASQKPIIFADNLWFNLTLGSDISKEEVNQICEKLDLSEIVKSKGYDYSLGDNADQLSGGQLARIELARAILAHRPVLLLDEINASLDRQTDHDIHQYLYDSTLTFIEVIHHYEPADLKKYDRVIDLGSNL